MVSIGCTFANKMQTDGKDLLAGSNLAGIKSDLSEFESQMSH
jgi:hypothetical protein